MMHDRGIKRESWKSVRVNSLVDPLVHPLVYGASCISGRAFTCLLRCDPHLMMYEQDKASCEGELLAMHTSESN